MNKTVLITGSSRGIGSAIAEKFSKNGYNIVINYLSSEKEANEICNNMVSSGVNAIAIKADVSKRDEVDKMIDIAIRKFGKIDVLVNNAGIAETEFFTEIKEDYFDKIFDINVKGVFNCSQSVAKDMISRKSGKIINISSIWGIVGSSMEVHYSATKGAVNAFTKALAKELAPSNIRVNAVAPGAVYTDMLKQLSDDVIDYVKNETPLGEIGTVEQVADAVFFLAESTGDFFTGQILSPNGGYTIF